MIKLIAFIFLFISTNSFASSEAKKTQKNLEVAISEIKNKTKSCEKKEINEKEVCLKEIDRKLAKAQYKKKAFSMCMIKKKNIKVCKKILSAKKKDCLFLKKGNMVCNNGNRFLSINNGKKIEEYQDNSGQSRNGNVKK